MQGEEAPPAEDVGKEVINMKVLLTLICFNVGVLVSGPL